MAKKSDSKLTDWRKGAVPSETVKLEITITREAVEALIEGLASLFPLNRESKEESTKEESKEINSPITQATTTATKTSNNTVVIEPVAYSNNISPVAYNNNLSTDNNEPTLEAIRQYIEEKGYRLDANRFYSYYRNNSWKTKIGNTILGRWRQYVDDWAKSERVNTSPNKDIRKGITQEEWDRTHPFVPTDFGDMT